MLDLFKEDPTLIYEIRQGIERESLRTLPNGNSSLAPHSKEMGSKLTHAYLTTDYSENLLEFITRVHSTTKSVLIDLEQTHAFAQGKIKGEFFWSNSMPCILPPDDEIPIADYGSSNVGKLKSLYRMGLGHRYGRTMQSIAGVHYNFSLSDNFWVLLKNQEKCEESLRDFKDKKYFHLMRNFHRYRWVLMYLFGASPLVDESFLTGKSHQLKKFSNRTLYTEEGTSLRMGGLGYTSSAQEQIKISYNEIDQYISALEKARLETYPPYEKIDEKKDNTRSQLNSNIIQIDNEFYSTIRPKNIAYSSESALKAIHERGVQYIEVRLLDVDPFTPLGISSETIHFMHLFLLWCLAKDSAPLDAGDCDESTYNFDQTVLRGRAKNLELKKEGKSILLADYLSDILAQIDLFAGAIKKVEPFYDIALDKQLRKLKDQDALPSQKLLNEVAGKSFIDYHLDLSRGYVDSYQITPEQKILFNKYTEETLNEQMRIEAEDNIDFDTFLKQYFDSIRINDLKV